MNTVDLNGERFKVEHLKPFGVQIERESSLDFDCVQWTRASVDSVLQFTKDHGVVVIRNTEPFPEGQSRVIGAPNSQSSTNMPHADRQGNPDALLWKVSGPRTKTGFLKHDEFTRLAEENVDDLKVSDEVSRESSFLRGLDAIYDGIRSDPVGFNPALLNSLFAKARFSKNLRNLIMITPSLLDRFCNIFRAKQIRQEQDNNDSEDACLAALAAFSASIHQDLSRFLEVDWRDCPDATVVAYNKHSLAPKVPQDTETIYHSSIPDETIRTQHSLYRMQIENGELVSGPLK